ncbi:MAG: hypothetical protein AVO33_03625 [delta proteobacterium ML8_F1]|nr:MAG: hypothetical protein AVO33_03625 [delta proteobacterium ML8_F1]
MIIEKITPLKKKEYRISFEDAEIVLFSPTLKAFQLFEGQTLSEDILSELLEKDAALRAYDKALHFLAYQARTMGEVEARLLKKGHAPGAVRQVLDRLRDEGLVDDAAYARDYAAFAGGRYGRIKILNYLRNKGISKEILEHLEIEESPRSAQRELRKKFGDTLDTTRYEDWVRGARFLTQRGFTYETVKKVLGQGEEDFFQG